MSPMLVVKKKMSTIKQPGKGDNARQSPDNITQLSKNNNSKKLLKSFFMSIYITAQLRVEKGLDAKRDDLTTSKGQYPKLMEG